MSAQTMRSKSFGERIADVLIEDGLLLPNQLEEAVAIQRSEGGRLLKQAMRHPAGLTLQGPLLAPLTRETPDA